MFSITVELLPDCVTVPIVSVGLVLRKVIPPEPVLTALKTPTAWFASSSRPPAVFAVSVLAVMVAPAESVSAPDHKTTLLAPTSMPACPSLVHTVRAPALLNWKSPDIVLPAILATALGRVKVTPLPPSARK